MYMYYNELFKHMDMKITNKLYLISFSVWKYMLLQLSFTGTLFLSALSRQSSSVQAASEEQ